MKFFITILIITLIQIVNAQTFQTDNMCKVYVGDVNFNNTEINGQIITNPQNTTINISYVFPLSELDNIYDQIVKLKNIQKKTEKDKLNLKQQENLLLQLHTNIKIEKEKVLLEKEAFNNQQLEFTNEFNKVKNELIDISNSHQDNRINSSINKKIQELITKGKLIIESTENCLINDFSYTILKNKNTNEFVYGFNIDEIRKDPNYIFVDDFKGNYARVRKNNKYGIIDINGVLKVDFIYDFVDDFKNGISVIRNNGDVFLMNENFELYFKFPEKTVYAQIINEHIIIVAEKTKHYRYKNYYIIDYTGKVLSIKYDSISVVNENYLSTLKVTNFFGLKYYENGLLSSTGKLLYKPIFKDVEDIAGKYVKTTCDNDLEGIIDEKNNVIFKCKYKIYGLIYEKHFGLYQILKNDKYVGFFSSKNGKRINFQNKYDFINQWNKNGLAIIRVDKKYGVIDTLGNEIMKPKYYSLDFEHNDFIVASKSKESQYKEFDKTNKTGVYSLSGNKILKSKYSNIQNFDDYYLVSQSQGTYNDYGLISKNLKFKTECIYRSDFKKTNSKGLAKILFNCGEKKRYKVIYRYETPYHYGLMNSNLEILLPCKYTSISNFNQFGIAIIEEMKIDDRFTFHETNIKIKGIINQDGKILISPKFLDIKPFSQNGIAVIKDKNYKFGLINSEGEIISSGKYNKIYSYDNNSFAKVETYDYIKINGDYQKQNIKYGIINLTGLEIFPVIFDNIKSTEYGYKLIYSNEIYKFNKKGICISNCVKYRKITTKHYE